MPGTSSQNTWTVGIILYFLSNYLSSCRSKEIQKTDKCQACACLLEVPRCAWKEVTSTLQLPLPLLATSQSIFMFFSKATNWPLSTTQIFYRLRARKTHQQNSCFHWVSWANKVRIQERILLKKHQCLILHSAFTCTASKEVLTPWRDQS